MWNNHTLLHSIHGIRLVWGDQYLKIMGSLASRFCHLIKELVEVVHGGKRNWTHHIMRWHLPHVELILDGMVTNDALASVMTHQWWVKWSMYPTFIQNKTNNGVDNNDISLVVHQGSLPRLGNLSFYQRSRLLGKENHEKSKLTNFEIYVYLCLTLASTI